ncbi:MAG: aminotransferase class III-fold pyridoxal phosphate-dependent enzyme [Myxococcales bacterium]|nr:aminotransferase class III-fold pyridoxal phosphate-dependent enzyme [Myxococcales bacterium]
MSYPFFFTWTSQRDAAPVQLVGGEGAFFDTADRGRYLDLGSLIYQANAGHGHRRIIEAVRAQAERLCLSVPGAVYPEKTALAEALLRHAPEGFTKVLFTLGGSDANENALKIARLVTGRHKAISRYRSYHGATLGAVSLTGDWRRVSVEPAIPGVVHVLDLDERAGRTGSTDIPRVLELEGNVGAVFLESIVGGNGVLIPSTESMLAIREACDAHGALLVVDEVLSGFGRTGRFFGLEHFDGLVPDMITMGKALTAGYGTLGAVLVHERVARHFEERVLVTGLTHYAHPISIAAALEAIRVYEDEGLVARAAALGPVLREGLEQLRDAHECATGVRAIGLLGSLELTLDAEAMGRLKRALDDERVHLHVNARAHCAIVAPPLVIEESDLREGIARLGRALGRVL